MVHACAPKQVKLVDAGFVWTEPHSRRLKVKLTIQAEVLGGAILQQTFVVEYVVEPHMCLDCTRANTNTSVWTACAQVRHPCMRAGCVGCCDWPCSYTLASGWGVD